MEQWILLRGNQQFGPYIPEQLHRMAQEGQLHPADWFCPVGGDRWMDVDGAMPLWKASPKKKTHKKKKGGRVFLLVLVLAVGGLLAAFFLTQNSDRIQVGRSQVLARQVLGEEGGSILIDTPGHPLSGMELLVPGEAHEGKWSVKISARSVEHHLLGSEVEAASPLISIDGLHEFSDEPMLLTIPIQLGEDEFAMGFFYDRKTGKLEGIPFVELTRNHITLMTHHFSDVVILKTEYLPLLETSLWTGFTPSIDDWQFVNRGSFIAPGGHCAGQSITAMFYYTEVHMARNEHRLYGQFDNNDYGLSTPDFWFDDSWGYRFASSAQQLIQWDSAHRSWTKFLGETVDGFTLAAFSFSMQQTGEPQYVAVSKREKKPDGTTLYSGHAIIAYGIHEGKIYVADPNFPGQGNRSIGFMETGSFLPYGSGANADEIETSGIVAYDTVHYMAKTALIDYSLLHEEYGKMLEHRAGEMDFPKYGIEYLKSVDSDSGEERWEPMPRELKLKVADTLKAGLEMEGMLRVRMTNNGWTNMFTNAYKGLSPPVQIRGSDKEIQAGLKGWYDIPLDFGTNDLGFLFAHETGGRIRYTDFYRTAVRYEQHADLELEYEEQMVLMLQKNTYQARVKKPPGNPLYVWDFGDGSEPLETDVPQVEYTYKEEGEFLLTLELWDGDTDEFLGMDQGRVEALNLYGEWNMDFTVLEAKKTNLIVSAINRGITEMILKAFGLGETRHEKEEEELEGSIIGFAMVLRPPAKEEDPHARVTLEARSSTHPTISLHGVWRGTMSVEDADRIVIQVKSDDEEYDDIMLFRGFIIREKTLLYGSVKSSLMSGGFEAKPVEGHPGGAIPD